MYQKSKIDTLEMLHDKSKFIMMGYCSHMTCGALEAFKISLITVCRIVTGNSMNSMHGICSNRDNVLLYMPSNMLSTQYSIPLEK